MATCKVRRARSALDAVKDEIECERNFKDGLARGDLALLTRAQAALDARSEAYRACASEERGRSADAEAANSSTTSEKRVFIITKRHDRRALAQGFAQSGAKSCFEFGG